MIRGSSRIFFNSKNATGFLLFATVITAYSALPLRPGTTEDYISVNCSLGGTQPKNVTNEIPILTPKFKPWVQQVLLSMPEDLTRMPLTIYCLEDRVDRLDRKIKSLFQRVPEQHTNLTLCASSNLELRFHLMITNSTSTEDCTHVLNCSNKKGTPVHNFSIVQGNWIFLNFNLKNDILYKASGNRFKSTKICVQPSVDNSGDTGTPTASRQTYITNPIFKTAREQQEEEQQRREEHARRRNWFIGLCAVIVLIPICSWYFCRQWYIYCCLLCRPLPPDHREFARQHGISQSQYARNLVTLAGEEPRSLAVFPSRYTAATMIAHDRAERRARRHSSEVAPGGSNATSRNHQSYRSRPRNHLAPEARPRSHSHGSRPTQPEQNSQTPSRRQSIQQDSISLPPNYDTVLLPSYDLAVEMEAKNRASSDTTQENQKPVLEVAAAVYPADISSEVRKYS